MKWIALAIALLAIVPAAATLRKRPSLADFVWIIFGMLPFVAPGVKVTEMALISWSQWPGYAKGLEIDLIDLVALTLMLSQPNKVRLLSATPWLLYGFAILLSAFQAPDAQPALFYLFQWLRIYIIFLAVANAPEPFPAYLNIYKGMALGVCWQLFVVLTQKATGVVQPSGTFAHQNTLGMCVHFFLYPAFALALSGREFNRMGLAAVAALLLSALTASRASIGLALLGVALIFLISGLQNWTRRKACGALLLLILSALIAPVVMWSLTSRFEVNPIDVAYDERAAFQAAAWRMIADYPFGVGANYFVVIANTLGYYDAAGVAEIAGSRSANVHNVFLLVTAETGWLGLFGFVVLCLASLVACLRGLMSRSLVAKPLYAELVAAVSLAIVLVLVHSNYEWVLVTTQVQVLFAISFGVAVGIGLVTRRELAKRP